MEKHGSNVGWKRGILNILIGLALGVFLIEVVATIKQMNAPTEQRIKRLHYEGGDTV